MKDLLKNEKFLLFVGGMAAAVVGTKILKSDCAKKQCVKAVASGMKIHQNAQVLLEEIKEEAEDIVYEAKELNNEDKEETAKEEA